MPKGDLEKGKKSATKINVDGLTPNSQNGFSMALSSMDVKAWASREADHVKRLDAYFGKRTKPITTAW
jgi:hypothetical protein